MTLIGWTYRKQHTITSAATLTDYQVRFRIYRTTGTDSSNTLYLESKCNADYSDIRFTTSNGTTQLSYWIEAIESTYADIWVKIPSITTDSTIYVYYGNESASSESDGDNTFIFFDDFTGTSLDTTKWNSIYKSSNSSYWFSDNKFYINIPDAQTTKDYIQLISLDSIPYPYTIETSIKIRGVYGWQHISSVYQRPLNYDYLNNNSYTTIDANFATISNATSLWVNRIGLSYTHAFGYNFKNVSLKCISGNVKVNLDSSTYTNTTAFSRTSGYILFTVNKYCGYCGGEPGEIGIDWVGIREYASTEPSHISWGEEQYIAEPFNVNVTPVTGNQPLTTSVFIGTNTTLHDIEIIYGDGETTSIPTLTGGHSESHIYTQFGTFNFHIVAYDPSDIKYTHNETITVTSAPQTCSFTYTQDNNAIQFTNTSTNYTECLWDFGDNSYSQEFHPSKLYTAPGTYTVTLHISNEYYHHSSTQSITVSNPIPSPSFTYTLLDDNIVPSKIQFNDTTTPDHTIGEHIVSRLWDFGNGQTSTIDGPTIYFTTAGTHTISLTITNNYGESDTTTQSFTLGVAPTANFAPSSYHAITTVPHTINFTNLSTGIPTPTYLWDFGDSTTSTDTDPSHNFTAHGNYTISLTATNDYGSSTKTYYNAVRLYNKARTFTESLSFTDTIDPFNIQVFIESATTTDLPLVYATILPETISIVQREIPDKPGVDEWGVRNLYTTINEWGHRIFNTLNSWGHKLIHPSSSIDQTGLRFFRTQAFNEEITITADHELEQT